VGEEQDGQVGRGGEVALVTQVLGVGLLDDSAPKNKQAREIQRRESGETGNREERRTRANVPRSWLTDSAAGAVAMAST
jgi:hypothetical protein